VQTSFEHYATTSMLGAPDAPPRCNAELTFQREWEGRVFGLALALSRDGHFEWETFRQALIESIGEWEALHGTDRVSSEWDYYQRWMLALERVLVDSALLTPEEIESALECTAGPAAEASER
jgi:nitrile hydratase accessory protein